MSSVILGVPLDDVTESGALDVIHALVIDGRETGRSHQVTTVNVDFVVNATRRPELLPILQRSSLNVADGAPLVWLSSVFGEKVSERVAGADLFKAFAAASVDRGWRIHVLGGAPGVGDRALEILLGTYPGAQITVDPGPVFDDPRDVPGEVLDDIVARAPDVLCVALGNPKQELFIDAHRERLGCPVMIGVGGSMDMLVGDRRRAPRWMQRMGAEWIFRAVQEPRRLGPRYLSDLRAFVPAIARQTRDIRYFAEHGRDIEIRRRGDAVIASPVRSLRLAGGDGVIVPRSPEWADLLVCDRPVHIDLAGCDSLTPSGHGAVCALVRLAGRFGQTLTVVGWSDSLRACFDRYGTGDWIDDVIGATRAAEDESIPESDPTTRPPHPATAIAENDVVRGTDDV